MRARVNDQPSNCIAQKRNITWHYKQIYSYEYILNVCMYVFWFWGIDTMAFYRKNTITSNVGSKAV